MSTSDCTQHHVLLLLSRAGKQCGPVTDSRTARAKNAFGRVPHISHRIVGTAA